MLTCEMDAKRSLRAHLLGNRSLMTNEQLTAAADGLAGQLKKLLESDRRSTIAAYLPFGTEPGGPGLPGLLSEFAATVLLPVLLPDKDLDWTRYGQTGTLGRQAISEAEMIIVPALAVDVAGYRLGRGGGSYDRALTRSASSALLVALLHEGEILAQVPHEPHDHKVHMALTPIGVTKLDR
jgi:5-formyltetrahydrofolate cyclo-ligase